MNDQANPHAQIAVAAQQMLQGVQLTGAQVPTYVGIHNWLEAIAQGQLVLAEPTAPSVGMTLPREVSVAPYDPANPEHPAPTQRAPGDAD